MCGIAGIVSRDNTDVSPLVKKMLMEMEHRGPDGAGISNGQAVSKAVSADNLDLTEVKGSMVIGYDRLAIVGGKYGTQLLTSYDGRIVMLHNGEIYNYKELKASLEGRHYFDTKTDSEVIVRLLEEYYDGDLPLALEKTLVDLDGVYAIAATDGENIVIARDPVGIKQLYFGENERFFAFASEKKALWSIGIPNEIQRLSPSHIGILTTAGIKLLEYENSLNGETETTIEDMDSAVDEYRKVLYQSVEKRIQNLEHIGMIFSGGIDSVLVAKIADDLGADITCYTSGVQGCRDLEYAKLSAQELGLNLTVCALSPEDIEGYIPEVIQTIEDKSFGQVEVAIPIYAAVEAASEDGQRVVLTGQGADELFGGYSWYPKVIERDGYEEFERRMKDDLLNLYKETLEREDKITMAHSIELRVPYLDLQVINLAMEVDPRLKIFSSQDQLGKHVHRELAESVEISSLLSKRLKEAAQHGAGIHQVIDSIARNNGFDENFVEMNDYKSEMSDNEKLGSSQRYGYKYGQSDLWVTPDHVQFYLDEVAHENGFLAESPELAEYLERIS